MNDTEFLSQYADHRLAQWWWKAPVPVRTEMLELLNALLKTPLAQLDQFTVGLHTSQPDGWDGLRLVFAIRNNPVPNSRATDRTRCLSLALMPNAIAATAALDCARRPNFDHPCRLNIDQGWKPVSIEAGCG